MKVSKDRFLRLIFLLSLVFFSGCIYVDSESPGAVKTRTEFKLESGDFKVIQRVNATGETTLWFGAVLIGGVGYQALLEEAQKVGGDTVMDYSFDMEKTSILFFIYSKVRWKATGIAVKLSDSLKM